MAAPGPAELPGGGVVRVRELSRWPGMPFPEHRIGNRYDAAGLLLATCPDRPAVVAAGGEPFIRDGRDTALSHLVYCERSSGRCWFDALAGAGESLGTGSRAFSAPGI